MRRREFIILLGSGVAAWPFGAHGQQEKLWRIGMLETISPALNAANLAAFRNGLRQLGYVEGQSYVIEYRSVEGRAARFPELASELVASKVDIIVTRGTPATLAAKNATATIPVIMAAIGEPLDTGVVTSLSRPGGNVTGFSFLRHRTRGQARRAVQRGDAQCNAHRISQQYEQPRHSAAMGGNEEGGSLVGHRDR
jgi:putative tryptophan/tyrosine transport system substrate-binding protein